MDPFQFDTRFARFLSQVDTAEIRRGTTLYESGQARVSKVSQQQIEGFVKTRDGDSHHVKLQLNPDGGLSGSCTCDTFFNCAHAYALSRATRDHLQRKPPVPELGGQNSEPKKQKPEPKDQPSAISHKPSAISHKPSAISHKQTPPPSPLQKLWTQTKHGKLPLYPADLTPFTQSQLRPALPPKEPLRELKRFLPDNGPQSPQDYADAIRALCDQKKIPLSPDFNATTNPSQANARYRAYKKSQRANTWQDAPPPLSFDYHFAPTESRDWFELTLVPKIQGHQFTPDEIAQLIKADGELVYLKGHGWRRVEKDAATNLQKKLAGLGLDLDPTPSSKTHRLHALQIEAFVPKEQRHTDSFKPVAARLAALQKIRLPAPPQNLQSILRPYQTTGFHFLAHLSLRGLGGILADDMGLGKTLQTLTWLMWLKEKKPNLRALIICPKSVTDNWIQEAQKFQTCLQTHLFRTPPQSVGPELAPGQQQARHSPKDDVGNPNTLATAHLIVTNYSILRLHADYFLKQKWDVAILDEGQYIKNPQSQTAKTAYRLKAQHRLILSGTPIENRISDLWSLMRFAMPSLLGSQQAFLADFNQSPDEHALANLRKRLQPFLLRRLKSEVARDLPERIEEEIHCELEGEQRALYEAELQKARQSLKNAGPTPDPKSRFNILSSLLRLRQICNHPHLLNQCPPSGRAASPRPPHPVTPEQREGGSPNAKTHSQACPSKLEERSGAKLAALLDLLEPIAAEGHQVLVFSQFVSMLEILKRALDEQKIGNLLLTGKTQNRSALVQQFQTDPTKTVFLLSLKAAGSGLNLTAASYVILFDPWWNPAVEAQAIDRTHRIGQTQQVIAYRLIAKDTVEEKIRQLQQDKAALANSIIQEDTLSPTLDLEDLQNLLA